MSRHLCSKELYTTFLRVTTQRYSAVSLSEVSPNPLSHDAVSEWLAETRSTPKDVWSEAKKFVTTNNGILIADDTIISKTRSQKMGLVRWQYSGNEHDIIRGIGVLNFLWSTGEDVCPFDFRIYEPQEDGKTKNDHFRDMLRATKDRGLMPDVVIADSWYSSLENLKCIRDFGWYWVMGLKCNRLVNRKVQLESLKIPQEGLYVHLRGYGWITVFRFDSKNGRTDYIGTNIPDPTRDIVEKYVKQRWDIEVYHRELKQTCGLEKCQSRTGRTQRNHIAFSMIAWISMSAIRRRLGLSLYQQQWNIVKLAVSKAMMNNL
jgi:hypothetical protein